MGVLEKGATTAISFSKTLVQASKYFLYRKVVGSLKPLIKKK